MNKFKVGDKVRIKKDLEADCYYDDCYFNSEMKKYRGEIATVDFCSTMNGIYLINIDNHGWNWSDEMLEEAQETAKSKTFYKKMPNDFTGTMKIENGFIVEIEKKKEILDEAEKEYLSAVIKPFKKQVEFISLKTRFTDNRVYIHIELKNNDCVVLQNFEQGTMYKNMELNKKYTLKELGLD